MKEKAAAYHLKVFIPELEYCTDNAAMIARAGMERLKQGYHSNLELNAYPALKLGEHY